ncbi:MAG: hypothetical protein ACKVRN_13920 [Pyrinomonadaceae bacterium]
MTPAEVLKEIQGMPLTEKRQIIRELSRELADEDVNGYSEKQKKFIASMKRKGLISQVPLRQPDPEWRRNFKPVIVTGESFSETVIRERR